MALMYRIRKDFERCKVCQIENELKSGEFRMHADMVNRVKQNTRRGFCASLLIVALALGANGPAQAALLNLTPSPPDVFSSFIDISYDAGSDIFQADGFATTLDDDGIGAAEGIAGGLFSLNATIDQSGSLSGGTIAIAGTVANLGFTSGTLLTGNLTDIGFADTGGDPLEFLFSITGGDLAGLYGGTGGVILSNTSFTSWLNSFQNAPFAGVSDTFAVSPIPVPAAVWLFGSALLGLAGYGRRSRRKQA